MDWGKTKNIFIISFLLLNLLLGYQLYIKFSENNNNQIWSRGNIEDLIVILDEKNIALNIDMTNDIPNMTFLKVNNEVIYENNLFSLTNDQNINYDIIKELLGDKIGNFMEYKYSAVESNNKDYFVYHQVKDNYPLFDAKIIVVVAKRGILTYSQNYFDIISVGLEKQVIPSYSALRIAVEQELIPQNSEIDSMELGYRGQENQSTIQDLTPVWKIVYYYENNINVIFIIAFTGGI